jgi:cytochrome P450/NADPH-cytochrome P450 reductase
MDAQKKTIEVVHEGRTLRVVFYAGASDASVEKAIRQALGWPAGRPLLMRSGDGDVVAVSASLPDGLRLHVQGEAPAATALLSPRGPRPYPLLGNIPQLLNHRGYVEAFSRLTAEYGSFVRLTLPGVPVYVCSDADILQEILSRGDDFMKRVSADNPRPPLDNLRAYSVGDGLFTSSDDEDAWQIAHRILLPALGQHALRQYYPRVLEVADEVFAHLDTLAAGEPVLVTDLMTRMTFEAIAHAGFSTRFNCITGPLPAFVQAMVDVLTDAMAAAKQILPGALRPLARRKRARADAILRETVDRIVAERRRALDRGDAVPHDILQILLTSRDKLTGRQLSDDNIRNQLITFLIAGHETTSGLLSYALYYAAANPQVEEGLIEEADRVLGRDYTHTPRFEDLDQLEYTTRVLKETLRLCPTAPGFNKTAMRDTVVGGRYAIAKGAKIVVFLAGLHRDRRHFGDDPERFDPDRFRPEAVAARHPHCYHPFGAGMRSCIGFQFALLEARMMLARFYQRYRARFHDPHYRLEHVETLTIKPRDLYLVLEKRPEERGRLPAPRQQPAAASAAPAPTGSHLLILYGSNMGASEELARTLAQQAASRGLSPQVAELDAFAGRLPTQHPLAIVTSTYNGTPPDNAARFATWLEQSDPARRPLAGLRYAVLGAGNKQWRTTYQRFPRYVHDRLEQLGGQPMHALGACDADGDFDGAAEAWLKGLWMALGGLFQLAPPAAGAEDDIVEIRYAVEVTNFAGAQRGALLPTKFPLQQEARAGVVRKNLELQSPHAGRSTRHIEIALPEGATYTAGDHLGVFPDNDPDVVEAVARRCGLRVSDVVIIRELAPDRTGETSPWPTGVPISVEDLLSHHVDLRGPLTRRELRALARHCPCPPECTTLSDLASEARFRSEILEQRLMLIDVLQRFSSVRCTLGLVLSLRPPLKPRYYSISSSPRVLPTACTITVGVQEFAGASGPPRQGVCSGYLARLGEGAPVRMPVKDTRSSFRLPEDPQKDVILIGPGTGIAPMRGFIEERAALIRSGVAVGRTVLFFGCRRPDHDFLYQDELEAYARTGVLAGLHAAFSRLPGQPRTYVQHRLLEQAAEVHRIIAGGGYVYVCGDARRMAVDVAAAFVDLFQRQAGMDAGQAEQHLLALRAEGRYLQDVWASA